MSQQPAGGCFLSGRGARFHAPRDGRQDALDRLLREEIAGTLRAITKLGGAIELVSPGALPNDGKVIVDERT